MCCTVAFWFGLEPRTRLGREEELTAAVSNATGATATRREEASEHGAEAQEEGPTREEEADGAGKGDAAAAPEEETAEVGAPGVPSWSAGSKAGEVRKATEEAARREDEKGDGASRQGKAAARWSSRPLRVELVFGGSPGEEAV